MHDEKAALMAALKPRPRIHVNVKKEKSFRVVRYTCFGEVCFLYVYVFYLTTRCSRLLIYNTHIRSMTTRKSSILLCFDPISMSSLSTRVVCPTALVTVFVHSCFGVDKLRSSLFWCQSTRFCSFVRAALWSRGRICCHHSYCWVQPG